MARLKEATRWRGTARRLRTARARRSVNLQTDAVRVAEEDSSALHAFGVRDNALVKELRAQTAHPHLSSAHVFDARDLERQVVEARRCTVEFPLALLSKREAKAVALAQERELFAHFV